MFKLSIQLNRTLKTLLATQHSNILHNNLSLVTKLTAHAECAIVVRKRDHGHGRLLNAITIIEVQRSLSLIRRIGRDPQYEILLPELRGCVCRFGAERQDGSAADVQGNGVDTDVCEVDHGAVTLDALAGPVVVEDFIGQVDGHGGRVFFQYRRDENGVAVEELVLDGEGVGVRGVVEPQGVQTGYTRGGLAVERSVEGTKCCPTCTEGFRGVTGKTANIGADHGNLVDGVEV